MADRLPGVLRIALLTAVGLVVGACVVPAAETTTTVVARTDPPVTTTEGTTTTVLSGTEHFPDGFTVPAGETWMFDPDVDTTVTVEGNVLVLGTLVMRPANDAIEHALIFENVDTSAFVGGGMDPVESDIGLWVMEEGQLLIEGAEKKAWAYEYDPDWEGDEVVAAPNSPEDYTTFEPVTSTPEPNELGYPTELLNLTRNVRIEGTPEGYTHIFIRSRKPQTIRYAALRYMAPEFGDSDATGRYGLHIHMSGDGTRGSIIEGVVIRDAANHAFVPHASHGITFRDTIAFNVKNEAYWWDPPGDDEEDDVPGPNDSNDVVWDRAVAALVDRSETGSRFRLSAFFLGNGENLTLTNSVAVGIQGQDGSDRAGFQWPEAAGDAWTFQNNIAHNNETNGIFVWQNASNRHDVEDFTAYYNEGAGVEHGAYSNAYQYRNLTLLENGNAVVSHALGESTEDADTQTWTNIRTEGGTLVIEQHARPLEEPVRFIGCDFSEIQVVDGEGEEPGGYEFVDCELTPESFDLEEAHPESFYRVQNSDGTAFELLGDGTSRAIEPFYSGE